ncbi:MAG: hypothetical protein IPK17_11395 [Chloroflexi bacterium]|uniref:FtsK/SpoIIIE domain-containing protein n=1 Tax=Candidatus Flexifilum breve TaxID=3140694 RepID=UPI003135EDA5|nr:hypothetical protein [Chloroflexota bacterium]
MFRRNKQKQVGAPTYIDSVIEDDYGTYIQAINSIVEARRRYDEQRAVLAVCDSVMAQCNNYGNDQRLTIDGAFSEGIGNAPSSADLRQVQQVQLNEWETRQAYETKQNLDVLRMQRFLDSTIQEIERELQQYYSLRDQLAKVLPTIRRARFWTLFWIVGLILIVGGSSFFGIARFDGLLGTIIPGAMGLFLLICIGQLLSRSGERGRIVRNVHHMRDKVYRLIADTRVSREQQSAKADEHARQFEAVRKASANTVEDVLHRYNGPDEMNAPERQLAEPWSRLETDQNYRPRTAGLGAPVIRIGTFHIPTLSEVQVLPAIAPLLTKTSEETLNDGHLIIVAGKAARETALSALQSEALRILAGFPARKARFTFIDPIGTGNTFPFKRLPDFITGPKSYTREEDIKEQLRALVNHLELVVHNYLAADFKHIEEFNEASNYIKEAYRFLFVADFPYGFDRSAIEDIKKLIANGPRAGIYVVIHADPTLEKPRDLNFETMLFPNSTVLQEQNGAFLVTFPKSLQSKYRLTPLQVVPDRTPSTEWINRFAANLIESSRSVTASGVPFSELAPSSDEVWTRNAARNIHVPFGLSGALDRLDFRLGDWEDSSGQKVTVNQALLTGKPGSGKSFTLHAIICNLALHYPPSELHMYLLDYKEGVEFRMYTDKKVGVSEGDTSNAASRETDETTVPRPLPHAQVVAIESEREFGLSVLRKLQAEIVSRGQLFKEAGVSELADYRRVRPNEILPRILLVIDEFQVLFVENDTIAAEANRLLDDIARRGRSFGLHMLLSSQSPNVANMSRDIYSRVDLRLVLQLDKNSAAVALADGNADAVDMLDRPGEIIVNAQAGRKDANILGQVANMTSTAREQVLDDLQAIARAKQWRRTTNLVVFRGNEPSSVRENNKLTILLQRQSWSDAISHRGSAVRWRDFFSDPDWVDKEKPLAAWIGEAIRIGSHASITLRRRARSNALIVGSDESSVFGMLGGTDHEFSCNVLPEQAEFAFIDLSQPDESWSDVAEDFARYLPYRFTIGERGAASKEGGIEVVRAIEVLDRVNEVLVERKRRRDEGEDESVFPTLIFILGGLHKLQQLRLVMGTVREEASDKAKVLNSIVAQGPELGIHTVVWVDSMQVFERTMQSRAWLTHFDLRIALTIPANDSQMLFGDASASKLPRLRGYTRDESSPQGLEKFKPYSLPPVDLIRQIGKSLKSRAPEKA